MNIDCVNCDDNEDNGVVEADVNEDLHLDHHPYCLAKMILIQYGVCTDHDPKDKLTAESRTAIHSSRSHHNPRLSFSSHSFDIVAVVHSFTLVTKPSLTYSSSKRWNQKSHSLSSSSSSSFTPHVHILLMDSSLPPNTCVRMKLYGTTMIVKWNQLQIQAGSIVQFYQVRINTSRKQSSFFHHYVHQTLVRNARASKRHKGVTILPSHSSERKVHPRNQICTILCDLCFDSRVPIQGNSFHILRPSFLHSSATSSGMTHTTATAAAEMDTIVQTLYTWFHNRNKDTVSSTLITPPAATSHSLSCFDTHHLHHDHLSSSSSLVEHSNIFGHEDYKSSRTRSLAQLKQSSVPTATVDILVYVIAVENIHIPSSSSSSVDMFSTTKTVSSSTSSSNTITSLRTTATNNNNTLVIITLQDAYYPTTSLFSMKMDFEDDCAYLIVDSIQGFSKGELIQDLVSFSKNQRRVLLTHVKIVDSKHVRTIPNPIVDAHNNHRNDKSRIGGSHTMDISSFVRQRKQQLYFIPTEQSQVFDTEVQEESPCVESFPHTFSPSIDPSSSSSIQKPYVEEIPLIPFLSIIWKIEWPSTGYQLERSDIRLPLTWTVLLEHLFIHKKSSCDTDNHHHDHTAAAETIVEYRPTILTLYHPLLKRKIQVYSSGHVMQTLFGSCEAGYLWNSIRYSLDNHGNLCNPISHVIMDIVHGLVRGNIELEFSFKPDRPSPSIQDSLTGRHAGLQLEVDDVCLVSTEK